MIKKFAIEKFTTMTKYSKPVLYPLDIDFRGFETFEDKRTNMRSFQLILDKNYEELSKYNEYENNFNWQNGLMFAAYLGDIEAVKCLLHEGGEVDSFELSALDYAKISNNQDIIQLLLEICPY